MSHELGRRRVSSRRQQWIGVNDMTLEFATIKLEFAKYCIEAMLLSTELATMCFFYNFLFGISTRGNYFGACAKDGFAYRESKLLTTPV